MKHSTDYYIDTEILDQVVTVRLASDLRHRIALEARRTGVSISEEIRRRLVGSFPPEPAREGARG